MDSTTSPEPAREPTPNSGADPDDTSGVLQVRGTTLSIGGEASPASVTFSAAASDVAGEFLDVQCPSKAAFLFTLSSGGFQVFARPPARGAQPLVTLAAAGGVGLTLSGTYAFFIDNAGTLRVVNVSTPGSAAYAGQLLLPPNLTQPTTPPPYYDLALSGTNGFAVGGAQRLVRIDLSTRTTPRLAWQGTIGTSTDPILTAIDLESGHAYIATKAGGLYVVDVTTDPPQLAGTLPPTFLRGWDVKTRGEYAYVAGGRSGLGVVDIARPQAPRFVSCRRLVNGVGVRALFWNVDNTLFALDEAGGLAVFDVSRPENPVVVGRMESYDGRAEALYVGCMRVYRCDRQTGLSTIPYVMTAAQPLTSAVFDAGVQVGIGASPAAGLALGVTGNTQLVGAVAIGAATPTAASLQITQAKQVGLSLRNDTGNPLVQFSKGSASTYVESDGAKIYVATRGAGNGTNAALTVSATGVDVEVPATHSQQLTVNTGNALSPAVIVTSSPSTGWGTGMLFANTAANSQSKKYGIFATSNLYIVDHTANTARMTFDPNGNVGIATGATALGARLVVKGAAQKTNGGQWDVISDARLKTSVAPLQGALDRLTRLQGVTFAWKEPDDEPGSHAGFVAQEVEKVFPEWIREGPPGPSEQPYIPDGESVKRLSLPNGFNAYLVEAIKELHQENARLRERLERLEKRLAKGENR